VFVKPGFWHASWDESGILSPMTALIQYGFTGFRGQTGIFACEVTYPQELGVKTNTWLQTHACKNRARDLVRYCPPKLYMLRFPTDN